MTQQLKNLSEMKDIEVACVTCNNMENVKRALKDSFQYFSDYYTENGVVTYDKDLKIVQKESMKELLGQEKYETLIKFFYDYIETIDVPFKVGNYLDERSAVIKCISSWKSGNFGAKRTNESVGKRKASS